MEKKQVDKRLEPFIGNDPNYIGYSESFKSSDFWMSTDELVAKMKRFSEEIQNAFTYTLILECMFFLCMKFFLKSHEWKKLNIDYLLSCSINQNLE